MKIRNLTVPWWMIIGVKIILSRIPIQYSFWKNLHLFEHGDMHLPHRAYENFIYHAKAAGVLDENSSPPKLLKTNAEFNVLELGPGDSLYTILIAKALGASRTWLVDAATFATMDMAKYVEMLGFLDKQGYNTQAFTKNPGTLADLLKNCHGEYLTEGIRSLAQVPTESVDFCFSQTVLQHIPKNEFNKMINELFRTLKPNGAIHHRVDLKDMLDGRLNNLRFSDTLWECKLFRNSGFYTNRIRFQEMTRLFENAPFKCKVPRIVRWPQLPTPREKMNPAFRKLPDDDLLVSGFDIFLQKP